MLLSIALLLVVLLAHTLARPAHAPANAGSIEIQFQYPLSTLGQRRLFVRGSRNGLSWSSGVLLDHVDTNIWTTAISYSVDDVGATLEFKALVEDAIWQIGSNSKIVFPAITTSPSPKNATRLLSGVVQAFPWFFMQMGNYGYVRHVYSPQLRNYRDLVVYTPPSYSENYLKKYNVLYMHDGQNLFNASTSFAGVAWQCQDTVNALVNEGSMEEVIIVGIDNTVNRTDELTYSYDASEKAGGHGNLYLDFIEQTVFGVVATWFRVQPGAMPAILGSSLGGLISCYAGYTRAAYSRAGCMSSSFWWNNEDFNNVILAQSAVGKGTVFYIDSGNAGVDNDDVVQTHTVAEHVLALGWQLNTSLFYYVDQGGQHR